MLTGPTLLAEIERFLRSFPCAETTFGKLAVGDGKLVKRLRAGRTVTLKKADQIIAFIRESEANKRRSRRGRERPPVSKRMVVEDQV